MPGHEDIAATPQSVLPEVPDETIAWAFRHMDPDEFQLALQRKLVPVAWYPQATLYADASDPRCPIARPLQMRIVGRISPDRFAAVVRQHLSRRLANAACEHLKTAAPIFSASKRFSIHQLLLGALMMTIGAGLIMVGAGTIAYHAFFLIMSTIFTCMVGLRLMAMFHRSPRQAVPLKLSDAQLPEYSVLVPVFREEKILPQLIRALSEISYPAGKLDIKLILEEKDMKTRRALARMILPPTIEVIVVPPGPLQTKPRALNYALNFARGSLLTIYDAEDIPDPMQLRTAAEYFVHLPDDVACLQSELAFFNSEDNWLTRQFAVEYATLFGLTLPMLARYRLPIPLGGTSNHFRTRVLRRLAGWDPFNVTEDADLGFRMVRLGYRTGMLPSSTMEEAAKYPRNWINQRARWLKGFMQTWLVHMRHPRHVIRETGWDGFIILQATQLGVFLSALLHPILAALLLWPVVSGGQQMSNAGSPDFLDSFYVGMLIMTYAILMFSGAVALARKGQRIWWGTILTMPAYWFLTGIAGWLAVWQFFWRPFHWNKTHHGITQFRR